MSAIQRREIACAILLDTRGRLLVQQRDSNPHIMHPGKISLFGGHREGSESYLQCVVREIHEEISYFVSPERFEYLTDYEAIDDGQNDVVVHAEFFIARGLPVEDLVITEGSPLFVRQSDLAAVEPRLTPSTRYAINAFLKCEESKNS